MATTSAVGVPPVPAVEVVKLKAAVPKFTTVVENVTVVRIAAEQFNRHEEHNNRLEWVGSRFAAQNRA